VSLDIKHHKGRLNISWYTTDTTARGARCGRRDNVVVAGLGIIGVAVAVLARAYINSPRTPQPTSIDAHPQMAAEVNDLHEPVRHSLRPWVLRGIEIEEAKLWIDRGFDADHAYLLRSMNVDPRTAGRLRKAGLDDSELVSLVEEASFSNQTGHDDLVALAERAPHLAPQAVAWMSLGVDADRALAYVAEGFTSAASDRWRGAGWDMDDALPWFAAKFEPASAKAWRANGFDPAEARAWKREHFGVKQAMEWQRLGDTPARAREVEQRFGEANITVADGLRWLDRGFSVDEICAGWPTMEAGSESGSWRADWKGLSLKPDEVTAWHRDFDHDEAASWLAAGVRDPAAARRLRARGLDPQDVRSVASDRLAEAFSGVAVTRVDLLSAAGQLAGAGGSPDIRRRLQAAAAANAAGDPKEVSAELIDEVLGELRRLDELGALGAPTAARALARRMERGLIVCALITTVPDHARSVHT
jgi:hypothetical protein